MRSTDILNPLAKALAVELSQQSGQSRSVIQHLNPHWLNVLKGDEIPYNILSA